MARKELKEQLDILETYINDVPLIIDPCKNCEFVDDNRQPHFENTETCKECCWYYDSKFKQRGSKK